MALGSSKLGGALIRGGALNWQNTVWPLPVTLLRVQTTFQKPVLRVISLMICGGEEIFEMNLVFSRKTRVSLWNNLFLPGGGPLKFFILISSSPTQDH